MSNFVISVNEMSVKVPCDYVEEIVASIPDEPVFNDVIAELSKSTDPKVRETIAYRDTLNEKTVHTLLKDNQIEVLRNLVKFHGSRKYIRDVDLSLMIKTGDCYLLESIIDDIDDFPLCSVDKIADELLAIDNLYAKRLMAKSILIGSNILEKLSNDSNVDVATQARETLKKK